MSVTNRLLALVLGAGPAAIAVAVLIDAVTFVAAGRAVIAPQQQWLQLRRPTHDAASIDRRGLEERLRHAALRDPDALAQPSSRVR